MKKLIILTCFFSFVFGVVCPTASGESGRGISLGVNFGTFPIASYFNSYRFGCEVGYRFAKGIGVSGEFAYGYTTDSFEWRGMALHSYKTTYSCIPISASLFFIRPVGKGFSIYGGLGLRYYSITIERDVTHSSTWGEPYRMSITDNIKGFAPFLNFGIEFAISNRITILSEVKQISFSKKLKEIEEYGGPDRNVHFGRPEVKIGIRFYFKD